MVAPGIDEFKRRAAERDRALPVDGLIGNDDVLALQRREPLLGARWAMTVAPASLNGLPPAM